VFLNAPGGGKRCEAIGKLVDSGQEQPTALHVEIRSVLLIVAFAFSAHSIAR